MAVKVVVANRPEPRTRPTFKATTAVDATRLKTQSYTVTLNTQGEVTPSTTGALVAEVAGSVVEISPDFVVGATFKKGDVLLQIDPRDYKISLTLAQAELANANALLAEEQARSKQAAIDWRKLGRRGQPSELTLRKPQLAAAVAKVAGAEGQVERAELDLQRSQLVARYDGRILSKQASIGQYVNRGTVLGEIYSTDSAEIRLPLTSAQLTHIDLQKSSNDKAPVTLSANISGKLHEWQAKLARTEGIDPASRQLYVVATIDNPYVLQTPLRKGQFVEAKLTGNTLDSVFVIPRAALREETQVLLVDNFGTLVKRDVTVAWKDSEVAVIEDGLQAGDVLCLTTLGSVSEGMKVSATIDGEAPQTENRRGGNRNGNGPKENSSEGRPQASQSGGNGQTGRPEGDGRQRMQELKKLIDNGQEIPADDRARVQARIDAGQPVPPWLKSHLQKTAE